MDDANHRIEGNGRAAWIAAAVERYELPLSRYASRFVRDPDQARDVVQDTFLRLCRQDQHTLDGNLAPWLYAVCRNRAVDILRKDHGEQPLDGVDVEDVLAGPPALEEAPAPPESGPPGSPALGPPASGPPALAGSSPSLTTALSRLSRNQQEVIRLKFQHGLKYREIAEVTGLSVTNVGFLIHTGIKKLRAALGESP
jgi:DNA-directed RNA polymerase specialized sigma24 family protein